MKKYVAALVACISLSGCEEEKQPPDVFNVSPPEAFKQLYHHPFTEFMQYSQCGILIYLNKKSYVQDKSITWLITSSGKHMLSFTVHMEPAGTGKTRMSVSISKDPNGREAYDGRQEYPRPAVKQPVPPAVEAQITQIFTGKKFDPVVLRQYGGDNKVCNIQRGGLESGAFRFRVDDIPGHDSATSARMRSQGKY